MARREASQAVQQGERMVSSGRFIFRRHLHKMHLHEALLCEHWRRHPRKQNKLSNNNNVCNSPSWKVEHSLSIAWGHWLCYGNERKDQSV